MSSAPPRVLVLLAAFNGARWIRDQLASIVNQANVDLQVVVSDDASSDSTSAEVLRFIERGDPVRLITRSVATGSAAQNFFSLIAQHPADDFEFVAFADQDDLWDEDKLVRACAALKSRSSAGYSSAVTAVWNDGRRRVITQGSSLTRSDYLFEGAGQGCTFVLRADFYQRVRDFFEDYAELTPRLHYHDWAIYALARSWGLNWTIDPQPTMQYRQHGGNDTGARLSLAGIAKRLSLIKGGWYYSQLSQVARLCVAAAPSDPVATQWQTVLNSTNGYRRKRLILEFCFRGGRRRTADNIVLLLAVLAGWI